MSHVGGLPFTDAETRFPQTDDVNPLPRAADDYLLQQLDEDGNSRPGADLNDPFGALSVRWRSIRHTVLAFIFKRTGYARRILRHNGIAGPA